MKMLTECRMMQWAMVKRMEGVEVVMKVKLCEGREVEVEVMVDVKHCEGGEEEASLGKRSS